MTPERVWGAITDPDQRSVYPFTLPVTSDWTPGSRYEFSGPGSRAKGVNLEVDPPRRLVQTYRAPWSDEVKSAGFTRVTWEIEPLGDSCRLLVVHDELPEGASGEVYGGWPQMLSGLKALLESGDQLTTPASLRFSETASA